ncbi:hypothetical protein SLEP1_g31397 [Rubroshorea leprosula]|uniref:DUF4218 domain-containing protein n=1 Tax=Rubroshorea leprosula TaxID=152421 RepID=A0AAV5K392_9ROSI|nr:hypothetical protein SLEP1_g31397 [Rubroshorea leprosula]
MYRKIAEHMTGHLKCREDVDEVIHLANSEAWKHFDGTHPTFVEKPRNVRLGLCTNGFNPFGCFATPYSWWPVFPIMYNFPPKLCVKSEHTFLAMIIDEPKSLGKNIDVMLRPLIDELKELWTNGIETYDNGAHMGSCHALIEWRTLRALTTPIIQVSNMKMWEEKIVETICKLEKVFLSAFFDSMEHLAIHLPYEAKVGGPVQFRWMYPFERKGWFAACKIRARAIIDTSSLSDGGNVYYQDDDPPMPQLVQPYHVSLASQGGEQVVISEVMQLPYVFDSAAVGATHYYQPPLDDDQYPGDDAIIEEDIEERNLEAELDAEFVVLDPELDAQLEEELSCAVLKTRGGMDKGDGALADPSQRKLLSLNCQGTFSHERFGRIATVIWKYLYDELVLFGLAGLRKRKGLLGRVFRLHCQNRFRDELHRARKAWVKCKKLPKFMHKDTFKILLAKWGSPKYIALQERDWDTLFWKEVVGPRKKGQMRGMSTLQDPAEHGTPWRRYDMSEAFSSTTKILTT